MAPRTIRGGAYVPILTPFDAEARVNVAALQALVERIAEAGCGLVLQGTNGEAAHLTREERSQVTRAVRKAVGADVPLVVGAGGGSLQETLALCTAAAHDGADAVLVLTPPHFAGAIAHDPTALVAYHKAVADHSPLPVMVYNFPGASAGIDLNSDLLIEIAHHPNILGAKLTCAQVGKGQRVVSALKKRGAPFHVWPGFADIVLPGYIVGMEGVIAGTGNVLPHTLKKLCDLSAQAAAGDAAALAEAQALQALVAEADWACAKTGIPGTKFATSAFWGVDLGAPRAPLREASPDTKSYLLTTLKEAVQHEAKLAQAAGSKFTPLL